MAQLIWTSPALTDLEGIADYIALDNLGAAKKPVKRVFSVVERLKKHPNSGRRPPELKRTSYREVIVGPCRVFYRVDGERIFILYVMRGERKLRQYLLEERNKERRQQ